MDSEKVLLGIAVVAFVVSVVAAGVTYFSVSNYATKLSGLVVATANLTVESAANINFTTDIINWGSGRHYTSSPAYLDTKAGTAVGGNWSNVSTPLTLENIGNVNVTLNLSVGKTAATFIGGSNPSYKWNVSNSEASSCVNSSGGVTQNHTLGVYYNPNTTTAMWCQVFGFADAADTIRIHFNLTVPADAFTGALGDIITATAVTAS
jgi:hypothetical protein